MSDLFLLWLIVSSAIFAIALLVRWIARALFQKTTERQQP